MLRIVGGVYTIEDVQYLAYELVLGRGGLFVLTEYKSSSFETNSGDLPGIFLMISSIAGWVDLTRYNKSSTSVTRFFSLLWCFVIGVILLLVVACSLTVSV